MYVIDWTTGIAIWAHITCVVDGSSVLGRPPAKAASFYPGKIVSTDTMNSMLTNDNINSHIISCLLPDNTADETCDQNIQNSWVSNLSYKPNIYLNPNVRLGNPKSQADTAISTITAKTKIGYVWIDVIDATYWPGPVSANQHFLSSFLDYLENYPWPSPSASFGIRTNELGWLNLMGNWTTPADNGTVLWNVLLDGDYNSGSVSFGGWRTADCKQYLEKNTLESTLVDLSNFSSEPESIRFKK